MKKTSVKPHILSWLQSNPAAGIKPYVFQRRLASSSGIIPQGSHLISRACLASTTAEGLLLDHRQMSWRSSWFFAFLWLVHPLRLAMIASVVCATDPGLSTLAMDNSGQPSSGQSVVQSPQNDSRSAVGEKKETEPPNAAPETRPETRPETDETR